MSKDTDKSMGYYKPHKLKENYFTITLPIKYCRKAKIDSNTLLHAVFNPRNKTITYKPQDPPSRKSKGSY